jgi:hypothetical protein
VAGLDEEADIGIHERHSHCDILPVWKNSAAVSPSLLNEAENIVPSSCYKYPFTRMQRRCLPATVKTGRVISQLIQNFFHLERGREGLDKNGSTDDIVRNANV